MYIPSRIWEGLNVFTRSLQGAARECINLEASWKQQLISQDACKNMIRTVKPFRHLGRNK